MSTATESLSRLQYDSYDLMFNLRRATEKKYLIRHGQRSEVNRNSLKLEFAKEDVKSLLEKYSGRLVVVGPASHARSVDEALELPSDESGLVTVEGRVRGSVNFSKALFKLLAVEGLVEVRYADFVQHEGCTYPTVEGAVCLDFPAPAAAVSA